MYRPTRLVEGRHHPSLEVLIGFGEIVNKKVSALKQCSGWCVEKVA
jgi:hypothetical protein